MTYTAILLIALAATQPKVSDKTPPQVVGIIQAGQNFPEARVCQSQSHPLLMWFATQHAKYMADTQTQGHQYFQYRFDYIQSKMGLSASEICAESWPWQARESPYALGWEMFKCWRQSPGHWSVACKQHKYFGCDMALGKNGVWYACIIVGD